MILGNAIPLYVAQLCRISIPILILPIVSRRLDLDMFGALASAQALAYLLMIIPEYGFALYAARAVAQRRDQPAELSAMTSRIIAIRLALCAVAILVGLIAGLALPPLRGDIALIAAMILFGLANGMVPSWFFQGLGEARQYAYLEITALLFLLALVFAIPFGPRDAAIVLALQGATLGTAVIIGHLMIARRVPLTVPALSTLWTPIRDGFPLFLNKLAQNVPGLGLLTIIGFILKPEAVGHYSAAERLLMGSANIIWPVMQILMPEIADRRKRDPIGADRLMKRGVLVLLCIGTALGAFLWIFAPFIIGILFGPKFEPTIAALRMVAFALPFVAFTNAVSNGVLVARGHDWLLTIATFIIAALSASLAVTLISPDTADRVAMIRLGVEMATACLIGTLAFGVIRRGS